MKDVYSSEFIPCEICGGTESTVIRDIIDIGKGSFGRRPVVACNNCGFLYQNPRFNKQFYKDYYATHYRNIVYGKPEPKQEFIDEQIKRSEILLKTIGRYFKRPGTMLDVGCSVGATMIPFIKEGWKALGTDPDIAYIIHGKEKLGLPVIAVDAEEMELEKNKYDFIMILGSLEHIYDPNITLELCRKASRRNALLLLGGRGEPKSHTRKYFNHNHHRYFTLNSLALIMIKHGWSPILTTSEPICGSTRLGEIYCLGRLSKIPDQETFLNIIKSGKREYIQDILKKFDELDKIKSPSP